MSRKQNISRFLLLFVMSVLAGCGQTRAEDSPTNPTTELYTSPQHYTMATLDGYTARDEAHNRDIPIFIRYPKEASGALPVIIWSHGGAKNDDGKYNNVEWGTALSEAGYIVIHMSHMKRTPQEKAALYQEFGVNEQQVIQNGYALSESTVDRPRDAIAVLDDLDSIEAYFKQTAPNLSFDRNAIGLAGHSFGSYTARTVAGARVNLAPSYEDVSFRDERPKVFLALSPQGPERFGFKEDSFQYLDRPDFSATGAGDLTEGEQPEDRVKGFELMPAGEKYLLFIDSPEAQHLTFNLNDSKTQPEFTAWIRSSGIAFFDAYLKNPPEAKTYLTSGTLEQISNNVATIQVKQDNQAVQDYSLVQSASSPPPSKPPSPEPSSPETPDKVQKRVDAAMDRLSQVAGFSEEQRSQIEPLMLEMLLQARPIIQDTATPIETRQIQLEELLESTRLKIEPLLTESQNMGFGIVWNQVSKQVMERLE